jgi:hypothetical protein
VNPNDPNVRLIEAAVRSLGDLCERLVFIGGTTTGLLMTDQTRPVDLAAAAVDVLGVILGGGGRGDHHLGGEQQARHGRRVLQSQRRDLGRVQDAHDDRSRR